MTTKRPSTPATPIHGLQFARVWGRKVGMFSTPAETFVDHYHSLISSGAIEPDPAQAEVADAFAALEGRLANYKPARKNGLFGRLFADKNGGPPHGLYVH